jgi:hypothetical protein
MSANEVSMATGLAEGRLGESLVPIVAGRADGR